MDTAHPTKSRTGAFSSKKELITAVAKAELTIDGKTITNPMHIFDTKKKVCWKGKPLERITAKTYIAINKPEGYLSSRLTPEDARLGKKSVFELVSNLDSQTEKSLFCTGRLDEDSSGLLIITNDGKLGSRITAPGSGIEKTYEAALARPITDEELDKLRKGVMIQLEENGKITSYTTRPCTAEIIPPGRKHLKLVLTEGKKREARRMLEALGNKVTRLERTAIGKLTLQELKIGKGQSAVVSDLAEKVGI
ncbi:rRNA pseudouridine synthase [Candidatus Woesearchaeota archaeon]|nr:rRNA pseudouridine synthase [Candidatus Woesearchaeota archaeon]